jgi:DNA-binding protein H-NS
MNAHGLRLMSLDELWALHELITSELTRKICSEKAELERKLRKLREETPPCNKTERHVRRRYPPVLPKYKNPARPSETWTGRGKQPRWLTAELSSGKKLDDFRIRSLSIRSGAALQNSAETKELRNASDLILDSELAATRLPLPSTKE